MTYIVNDNGVDREMTKKEIAAYETVLENDKINEEKALQRQQAKQAVIEKLGLTAEELAALLS